MVIQRALGHSGTPLGSSPFDDPALLGVPWDELIARTLFHIPKQKCSVVRDSRMWCPHDIGRDSWVWGEQGTLEMMNSPHELGDEALVERRPLSGGNGVALG